MIKKELFDYVSLRSSKLVTNAYSTSFSLGIRMLHKEIRNPIYAIYAFVRFADEIVDSFDGYEKQELLEDFKQQTSEAIEKGISLNPILNSFQNVVNYYNVDLWLIEAFFDSMAMDLNPVEYTDEKFEKYILGSAQVVGLMCLRVFCNGNSEQYDSLKDGAMSLGAAFQKVNFLRDLRADKEELGRLYFPGMKTSEWNSELKAKIEDDIREDFRLSLIAINKLPLNSKFGVYTAYRFYYKLFKKMESVSFEELFKRRLRITNMSKFKLLLTSKARMTLGKSF